MDFLKENQKLQLVVDSEQEESSAFACRIVSVSRHSIIVTRPTLRYGLPELSAETPLEALAIEPGVVYKFKTHFDEMNDETATYTLALPTEYTKVQRREYIRVDLTLPITVQKRNTKATIFKTESIDISAGGVKVSSPYECSIEDLLDVAISLPDKEIKTEAKVVRAESNHYSKNNFPEYDYALALCYSKINDADRSSVLQLCLKRQLELKQRGIA